MFFFTFVRLFRINLTVRSIELFEESEMSSVPCMCVCVCVCVCVTQHIPVFMCGLTRSSMCDVCVTLKIKSWRSAMNQTQHWAPDVFLSHVLFHNAHRVVPVCCCEPLVFTRVLHPHSEVHTGTTSTTQQHRG